MKGKLVSLLILVLIILTACNADTIEKDGFKYSLTNNPSTAILTSYTGKDKEVEIPSEVDGYPVTHIGSILKDEDDKGVFEGLDIIKITIGENVKVIFEKTFADCASLETVTMSGSIEIIKDKAFLNCVKVKAIEISSDYDKGTVLQNSVFEGCSALESVTLINIRSIWSNAFKGCTSLTEIYLDKDVNMVFADAFSGCNSLDIYCEANEAECGEWAENWNSGRPVHYNSSRTDFN